MAKDYFQDITPPSDDSGISRPPARPPMPAPTPPTPEPAPVHLDAPDDDTLQVPIRVSNNPPPSSPRPPEGVRGIRNIPATRPVRQRVVGGDMREASLGMGNGGLPPRPRARTSRWWMWGAAILALIIVAVLGFVALRSTTVTVTPQSHAVVLTDATTFTANPAATAASGTLAYTVQSSDLDDSEVVTATTGTTTTAASKASGSITVFNAYSTASVHLIKNTRFETPDGLVFRVPDDIVVPAMQGTTPGKVQVTVVADQTGEQYNVGPVTRFTLPGLESNAAMYSKVYASSASAMTGGSSGVTGPGVAPAALATAVSDIEARLQTKAEQTATAQAGTGNIVLPALIQITYASEPNTNEAGGGVRVHETAHVQVPVFSATDLGSAVGSIVSADANGASVTLIPGSGFAAEATGTPADLGTDPLNFTLTGQANLVWNIDTAALAAALAGRDQGAFNTVVNGFPGIAEAHAKIEPFWKSTFPANPSDIKITVTAPAATQ